MTQPVLFELGSACPETSRARPAKAIARMHLKHGPGPDGRTCRRCDHLLRDPWHRRTYFKCRLFGVTSGPATDWRLNWPACGKFTERAAGTR